MDVINKINSTAFGYNQNLAVRATNQPQTVLSRDENVFQSSFRFGENQFAVPFRISLASNPDDVFTFPLDPIVSIDGGNQVVKREVAKSVMRGTIKELWTQNDVKISVSGVINSDDHHSVDEYVERLLHFLQADEALGVECDVLNNVHNIQYVVVESWSMPFTKGVDAQSFTIELTSDESFDLELEDNATNE